MSWNTRRLYVVVGLLCLACAAEDRRETPVGPPSFSHGGPHTVSGVIRGPDGTSICNFLPSGGFVRMRLINVPDGTIAASQFVSCPTDAYFLSANPGSYFLRVTVLVTPTLATIPLAEIDLSPVVLDGGDVIRDFQVVEGLPLLGQATLDGQPVAVRLDFLQQAAPGLLAGTSVSGADGSWTDDFFGRPVMMLQGEITYNVAASGCGLLGARTVVAPPTSLAFSAENQRVDCILETGTPAPFTHRLTRLVATPMPGEIGGQCQSVTGDFGLGLGVQFPVDPSTAPPPVPFSATHLFCGGLLIGVVPNIVLSGVNLGNYGLDCGAACVDLGLDGKVSFEDKGALGKKVTWSYTDAPSPERVGLHVRQRSFDGRPPADYILFQFSVRNLGRSTQTLYVGFFGDWDVDDDFLDDVGATDLGGRLMYMTSTNPDDRGTFVGTLFLGDAPVSGTFFWDNSNRPQSLAAQMDALSGALTRQTADPQDNRVIQAVGPITLAPRGTADVWMAVVAGENLTQLLASAAAAEADVAARRAGPTAETTVSGAVTLQPQPNVGAARLVKPAARPPED